MKYINEERKEFLNRENFSSQNEMVSLNETINQDFFVEQLEERLETDPLAVGGLFDLFAGQGDVIQPTCIVNVGCREYSVDINL